MGHISIFDMRHKNRYLSAEEALAILGSCEDFTNKQLAEKYRVSPTTIYDLISGKTYKELSRA